MERDGGATASYLFWVLDVLGHEKMRILDGGIDAWRRSGFDMNSTPAQLSAILYQGPMDEIKSDRIINGDFVYQRLGDPYYQIIDVRSQPEYVGEKGTKDLRGNPLKLGHIPTAVNVDYRLNWVDKKTKTIQSHRALQDLYRGLDPDRGVIVYCNSGRRSSFSYFVLRLMGIGNVYTYEASWKQWGNPAMFYPVETTQRKLAGTELPEASRRSMKGGATKSEMRSDAGSEQTAGQPKGGYVSCGG